MAGTRNVFNWFKAIRFSQISYILSERVPNVDLLSMSNWVSIDLARPRLIYYDRARHRTI